MEKKSPDIENVYAAAERSKEKIFESFIPEIIDATSNVVVSDSKNVVSSLETWMHDSIQQTPEGKRMIRGEFVVLTYKAAIRMPFYNLNGAYILGWIVEMVAWLTFNDMRDFGQLKETSPQVHSHGRPAVTQYSFDTFLPFKLLEYYFKEFDCYEQLRSNLQTMVTMSMFGNVLEETLLLTAKRSILESYTQDSYKALVKHKIGYRELATPVALGFILAGHGSDEQLMTKVEKIIQKIAYYFQVQDNFSNCFEVKLMGTDIQDRKCTWLFVNAARLANQAQKTVLRKDYGKTKRKSIKEVKKVYEDLGLQAEFRKHDKDSLGEIHEIMYDLSEYVKHRVFTNMFIEIINRLHKKSGFHDD